MLHVDLRKFRKSTLSIFPCGVAEDTAGEECRFVTGFSGKTAGGFNPVEVIGAVVEIIRIGVLFMAHNVDRVAGIISKFSEFLFQHIHIIIIAA